MTKLLKQSEFAVILALLLALFNGCATALAPAYDEALVDGLTEISASVMQLFASTSAGTEQATYAERRDDYNRLIGSLDALAIQARARPIPKNRVTAKVNHYLESRGIDALEGDGAPSAVAMEKMSATLAKMRDTDQQQGVTAFEVVAFRGQVVIYMDQAMTYESFLER